MKDHDTAAWVQDEADTFDLEEGKKATYALLGKPGFDEKRAELAARPAEDPAYIL